MKKTAIITLTFNKLEQATKQFLDSLYEFISEDDFDLILVKVIIFKVLELKFILKKN